MDEEKEKESIFTSQERRMTEAGIMMKDKGKEEYLSRMGRYLMGYLMKMKTSLLLEQSILILKGTLLKQQMEDL